MGTIGDMAMLSLETLSRGDYPIESFRSPQHPCVRRGEEASPDDRSGDNERQLLDPKQVICSDFKAESSPRVWLPQTDVRFRAICSTEFLVAEPKAALDRMYVYLLLGSEPFLDEFASRVTGTSCSHQRVKPEDLLRIETYLTPEPIRNALAAIVAAMLERIESGRSESQVFGRRPRRVAAEASERRVES